jgi:hypothetical protein
MLVVNTSMKMKGIGFTLARPRRFSIAAVMKRIDVTSSTSAAATAASTIMTTMIRRGCGPTIRSMRSITDSKKCSSSRKPITVIIAIRKRMMSNPANSMRCAISSSPVARSRKSPMQAKASRCFQKKIAPKRITQKAPTARICGSDSPRFATRSGVTRTPSAYPT